MSLKSGGHTKYELKYHFVWCPKYRKMILKGNIGKYVAHVIYEIAERYGFEVVELAVMPDHVHLFVSATPETSPAHLLQMIKSITARAVFKRFPGITTFPLGRSPLGARLFRHEFRDRHHRRNDTPIYQRPASPFGRKRSGERSPPLEATELARWGVTFFEVTQTPSGGRSDNYTLDTMPNTDGRTPSP